MILSNEQIGAANASSTHAVDIVAFVEAKEIPLLHFDTPYYLAPAPGGEKVYAVLRETLQRTQKVAIAYIVIHARRQLAALMPRGSALVLNTLGRAGESSPVDDRGASSHGVEVADVTELELETAMELVDSMTAKWDASLYRDGAAGELAARTKMEAAKMSDLLLEPPQDEFDDEELTDDDLRYILRRRVHLWNEPAVIRQPAAYQAHRGSRPRARSRRSHT